MVRTTLQSDIVDEIGRAIVNHQLAPGSTLRTDDFMTQFDASRSVVREALKVLESMNLVSMRRNVGVTIRPRSEWSHFDSRLIRWRLDGDEREEQLILLTQLREAVEPLSAHYAAQLATIDERAELVRLARRLQHDFRVQDMDSFHEHDIAFHRQLLEASHNEMFGSLSSVVTEVLRGRRPNPQDPDHPTLTAVDMHLEVALSIDAADSTGAETALRSILDEVRAQILSPLNSESS